jgi:hypothetical protein
VLGLVVGYSGEASSDVYRVADFVATRLASKHLEYFRTSKSIAKAHLEFSCRYCTHEGTVPYRSSARTSCREDVGVSFVALGILEPQVAIDFD